MLEGADDVCVDLLLVPIHASKYARHRPRRRPQHPRRHTPHTILHNLPRCLPRPAAHCPHTHPKTYMNMQLHFITSIHAHNKSPSYRQRQKQRQRQRQRQREKQRQIGDQSRVSGGIEALGESSVAEKGRGAGARRLKQRQQMHAGPRAAGAPSTPSPPSTPAPRPLAAAPWPAGPRPPPAVGALLPPLCVGVGVPCARAGARCGYHAPSRHASRHWSRRVCSPRACALRR